MDDPSFVRGVERIGDLPRNRERLWNGQSPATCLVSGELVRKGVTLDQLQHQRSNAVRLLDAVDRTDVWMIEGREHARFTLEPGEAVGIGSKGTRQDLDRDVSSQLRVAGTVHFAHPAFANLRRDPIRPDRLADSASPTDSTRHGRSTQERGSAVMCQQRLDVTAQLVIARACVGQKQSAFVSGACERLVIEPFGPRPALRRRHVGNHPAHAPTRLSPGANPV